MTNWVGIFNVTPETRILTIHAMLQFGQIVKQHIVSDSIIIVQFQESISAQAALLKRAMPISSTHVIGIIPVQDNWLSNITDSQSNINAISKCPESRMPKVKQNWLQQFLDWLL